MLLLGAGIRFLVLSFLHFMYEWFFTFLWAAFCYILVLHFAAPLTQYFFMCGLCCLGRCAFVVLLSPVFVWLGLYVTPNLWTVLSVFFVLLS